MPELNAGCDKIMLDVPPAQAEKVPYGATQSESSEDQKTQHL